MSTSTNRPETGVRRHVVAQVEDMPPGSRKIVEIEGRSIGVFNVGGEFFALRNTCPHEGGPLCEGVLSGLVTSEKPGEYDYSRRGEILRCPWHQWEFDIRSGQSWVNPQTNRVRCYRTVVASGASLTGSEIEMVEHGMAKGPYIADTFPVRVEGRYVLVEA